jgi:DNA-binding protein Fis
MIKCIDEDNLTIKQHMGLETGGIQPMPKEVVQAFKQQQKQNEQEFNDFVKLAIALKEINPPLFDAIQDVIHFFDHYQEDEEVSVGAWPPQFTKNLGLGVNLSAAIKHINRYGSEDRRTNLSGEDLMRAIKSLLNELTRRRVHGIDES